MNELYLLVPILLPILAGIILMVIRPKSKKVRNIFIFISAVLTSVFIISLAINTPENSIRLLQVTQSITLDLKLDGLGIVFSVLMAILWPLASLYAFEYMAHEKNLDMFFGFYIITYGVAVGIAFSGNALTMYLFYEFLTLVTTPLVLHTQKREAVKAARKYLYYSITGAALGFIAVVFVLVFGENAMFQYGGFINSEEFDQVLMQVAYAFAFVGFGVKAAIFPLHGWLPSASVAPTPVTALLHAVAVVKSGAFVIMRMTYYVFGVDLLKDTWAQVFVTLIAVVTIFYASIKAMKENHFKRRLAYSTISNLSYILLGVSFFSPLGLLGALTHMVFHAVMKISSFFCAGAVMEYAKLNYVDELKGLARKMPFTFTCFSISSLSLMGMIPFVGFMSKFRLISAAVENPTWLSCLAVFTLFSSAVFVAIYLVLIPIRAIFAEPTVDISKAHDPKILMKIPITIFTIFIIVAGVYSSPIIDFLSKVSQGLI